jgi:CHAD domain-containing protein
VRSTLERELKLEPPDGFVLPSVDGERLPTRTFASTYVDTPDLRLAAAGVTLRYRLEDGAGVWQLKLPRGDARVELEQDGPPARPPEELVALLTAHLRGRELVRVARMRTRRDTIRTQAADIVDDAVAVFDGPRIRMRFRELEVELTAGDADSLLELERVLAAAGARPGGGTPKAFRALGYEPTAEVRLSSSTTPLAALGERLRREYARLLGHDAGVRLGDDPEDVHQLRVATRRLRAYLRVARPLVDRAWADELRAELAWLGGTLGAARDLDVMLERLREDVGQDAETDEVAGSLLSALEVERADAYASAVEALSEPRYLGLLDRLEQEASSPVPSGAETVPLARLFRRELERCRRTFDRLASDPSDEALHEARIRVKRARYAAELAEHELGDAGPPFIAAAKKLQDALGEHQDAVVAQARITGWVDAHPDASAFAERLLELERSRQSASRKAWPKLWRKLERRGRKA